MCFILISHPASSEEALHNVLIWIMAKQRGQACVPFQTILDEFYIGPNISLWLFLLSMGPKEKCLTNENKNKMEQTLLGHVGEAYIKCWLLLFTPKTRFIVIASIFRGYGTTIREP